MGKRRRQSRKRRGLTPGEVQRQGQKHVPPPTGALLWWLAALDAGFVTWLAVVAAAAIGIWLAAHTGSAYWIGLVVPAYCLRFWTSDGPSRLDSGGYGTGFANGSAR